ncbi:hypothetical protein BAE44_0024086 [Dichanthelium oligosanthes]|uniref:Uncharacterized protein n=1 Tax=Dichanthelium oligosanthes TaxID=888268 RepID=A0A1E5UQ13_9POAL|nr:hypothetical protein BAE44_0024086 [Dichanthelium oligosanthes]
MMAAGYGDDDLAAVLPHAADLDLAYRLQLTEAIKASFLAHPPPNAAASSSSSQAAAAASDRWGYYLEHPLALDSSSALPRFRILFKGMTSKEVLGPRVPDSGLAVLAAAVVGPRGEVVLRVQKPVEGFLGGHKTIELMALMEGLHAALRLGIRSATILTDYMLLHNHEYVRVKLLHGTLPTCPQDCCTTKLSVEGSKIFLSPQLLEIMVERVREGSCSKYTVADAVTLRKCVKCRGSFCMSFAVMNSATHAGGNGRRRRQAAPAHCIRYDSEDDDDYDDGDDDEDYYDEEDAYYGRGPFHNVVRLPFHGRVVH